MISIIVPVYNAEKTIARCLDSILAQKHIKMEIITVNDGSSDSSLSILNSYSEKNDNIIVINKTNGGVSNARNAGLQIAKGDYIAFIDSDDFYIKDTYLYDQISIMKSNIEIDMVIAGYTVLYETTQKSICTNGSIVEISDLAYNFAQYQSMGLMNSPWNKLFKKEFIFDAFDERIKMGEDAIFVLRYLKKCRKIAFCENVGYGYIYLGCSTTADFRKKEAYDVKQSQIYHCAFYDFWKTFLNNEQLAERYLSFYTDEVYLQMRSLLSKKGLSAFLKTDISDTLQDDGLTSLKDIDLECLKKYKHKKLTRLILKNSCKRIKIYCLWAMIIRKVLRVFRGNQ